MYSAALVRYAHQVPCTGATLGATLTCCQRPGGVTWLSAAVQHGMLLSAAPCVLLPCVACAALMLWQRLQDSLLCPHVVLLFSLQLLWVTFIR
jgi:hypothetical protein